MPDAPPARTPLWQPLGALDPRSLSASRLALHQAVQILASFGQTLVEARDDDSHRSLTWRMSRQAFRSEKSGDGFQALVLVGEFSLELRRHDGFVARMALHGRTVEEARRWLGAAVGQARGSDSLEMAWPEYDIPENPAGAGAPLEPDPAALKELARWYGDADLVLADVVAAWPEASPIRCWPHHFDLATLLTFPTADEGREPYYVGVGLSPGDESRDHPYLYVNGWPSPDPRFLPKLDGPGHWNTEGWVGAFLPAHDVVMERRSREQAALMDGFVARAMAAMRAALLVQERDP